VLFACFSVWLSFQKLTRGAFAEVARGPGCALGLQLLLFATLAQPKSLARTNFKAPKTRPPRNANFPRFFSARLVAALAEAMPSPPSSLSPTAALLPRGVLHRGRRGRGRRPGLPPPAAPPQPPRRHGRPAGLGPRPVVFIHYPHSNPHPS
jgi:hypothetical protein